MSVREDISTLVRLQGLVEANGLSDKYGDQIAALLKSAAGTGSAWDEEDSNLDAVLASRDQRGAAQKKDREEKERRLIRSLRRLLD